MFLKNYKFNSFKKKIENIILKEIYNSIIVSRRISENYINHCWADKLNPEESVLYIIGKHLETSKNYDAASDFRISSDWDRTVSIKEWHVYAEKWRDEGKVSRPIFDEFNGALNYVKERWPQLYIGEEPEIRALWQLYYNSGDEHYSDGKSEPIKIFKEYREAIDYIVKNSKSDLWWHSYDLGRIYYQRQSTINYFKSEKISPEKYSEDINFPAWIKNDPPNADLMVNREKWNEQFKSDEFGQYAVSHLFATSKESYHEFVQQVADRNKHHLVFIEPDIDILLRDSWWLNHDTFDVPIDNHDPDSVPYNMLVKKVS